MGRSGGSATPTSDAARASREGNHHLTFAPDQSVGLITAPRNFSGQDLVILRGHFLLFLS
jgi:hypothetical protein